MIGTITCDTPQSAVDGYFRLRKSLFPMHRHQRVGPRQQTRSRHRANQRAIIIIGGQPNTLTLTDDQPRAVVISR
jgi:hypothetical protein